jgi:hypothetical protein
MRPVPASHLHAVDIPGESVRHRADAHERSRDAVDVGRS